MAKSTVKNFENDFSELLKKYKNEPKRVALLILDAQKKLKDLAEDGVINSKTGNTGYDNIISTLNSIQKKDIKIIEDLLQEMRDELPDNELPDEKTAPVVIKEYFSNLSVLPIEEVPHFLKGALDKIGRAANILQTTARDQRAFNQQKTNINKLLKTIQDNIVMYVQEENNKK